MKAMVVRAPGGLDRLELVELSDPGAPGPGEIRVRVHATSLNFHDYAVAKGLRTAADRRILMADGAGVVEAVGAGVTEFATGDKVVSCFFPQWQNGEATVGDFSGVPGDGIDGYACEIVVRPANWFTRAPRHLTYAETSTITTAGLTAWRALVADGHLKPGETVLILGTGGVSIFALQLAKAMGATAIVTSSSDQKLERARSLGADHTINYKAQPEWSNRVRELTGGRGVDHVVEVGGPGTLPQSITAVRIGGQIWMIGVLTGRAGEVPTGLLMNKQVRLQGLVVGSRAQQIDLVRGLESSGMKPVVDRVFPLHEMADAFRLEESGGHFGKICLEY
jgi:NADPH:quinone reductase-like Zn-dependent oxidoreductase